MKKLFLLLSIMTLITGCIFNNNDDEKEDNNGIGLSAETYFPLKTAATWTHLNTGIDNGEAFTDTTTSTIVGTLTNN